MNNDSITGRTRLWLYRFILAVITLIGLGIAITRMEAKDAWGAAFCVAMVVAADCLLVCLHRLERREWLSVMLCWAVLALGMYDGSARAQTTNEIGVLGKVFDFLGQASTNLIIAPYGLYDGGSKTAGGGLALGYRASANIVPTLRLDYVNGEIWMPSASVTLQVPVPVGSWTLYPLTFAGVAVPISGQGSGNGAAVGIFGMGAALKLSDRIDLLADVEKWSGANFTGLQYRVGVGFKTGSGTPGLTQAAKAVGFITKPIAGLFRKRT